MEDQETFLEQGAVLCRHANLYNVTFWISVQVAAGLWAYLNYLWEMLLSLPLEKELFDKNRLFIKIFLLFSTMIPFIFTSSSKDTIIRK